MNRLAPWLAACALALGVTSAQAAPTLLIDASGELTGANGVDVGGTLYDVRFVDGTCAAVYSGCDDASDFAFATTAAAAPASQALLDQVLLDVAGGLFDSDPTLTLGCDFVSLCQIRTAVADGTSPLMVSRSDANNVNSGADAVGSSCCGFDTAANTLAVYAVWTRAQNQVPEPSSLLSAAAALLALGLVRRRRR